MADTVSVLPVVESVSATYLNSLDTKQSRQTMQKALRNLQALLGRPLPTITVEDLPFLRASIAAKWPSPASRNKHLVALRNYVKTAHRMGKLGDDVLRESSATRNFRGTRSLRGRLVLQVELDALLAQCPQQEAAAARDGAMLVLLRAGLRRSEVVGVNLEDFDQGFARVKVLGKGDKERIVPLPSEAKPYIMRWLAHRDLQPGPFLTDTRMLPELSRLHDSAPYERLEILWRQAKLPGDAPTPHDFRRTLASELLDKQIDPHTVQEILGHSSLDTTMIYDLRPGERRDAAMEQISMNSQNEDDDA